MNCCRPNLRWFNTCHKNNPQSKSCYIGVASEYIAYQSYVNTFCNKKPCFREKHTSSSYTSSLKANLLYPAKFSTCNNKNKHTSFQ